MEDRFGLSSVSGLFSVVPTFTLGVQGSLTSLVLGDLKGGVLVQRFAERFSSLRYVDHTGSDSI